MKKILLLVAAIGFVAGCNRNIDTEVPDQQVQEDTPAIVPGEAIVLFSDEMMNIIEEDLVSGHIVTKSSELNSIQEYLGVKSMRRVFPHAGRFEERTRTEGLHRWYKLEFDPSLPVTKATNDLASIDGIEIVEPVRRTARADVFNDPKFNLQWHYYNDGSLDKSYAAGADINVVPVWENYTTGNPDVIVAIVDGGIDYEHEDLAGNYAGGFNFVRGTTKVVAHDHGTHVAGTVAAVNNNGIGVSGVAGGDFKNGQKGVSLLSCQITEYDSVDPSKELWADGAEAIKWGADNGAVISQNSWGYVYETEEEQAAATIPRHLAAAIDYFIKYAGMNESGKQEGPMAGGVVFFASANDARGSSPICEYEPVIAVGAIGPDFTRAYYSNYGDYVDICAPGGSAYYPKGEIYSTVPGNKYDYMQGTSMACPHVSGVAALVVSHFAGPGFTNTTLVDKLLNGANSSVISKNAKIGPLVDAFGAMTYGGKIAPDPVSSYTAVPVSNSIALTYNVPRDRDDKKAYGFTIVAAKDKQSFAGLDPASIPDDVKSSLVMTGNLAAGAEMTAVIDDLEFNQKYYVAVAAFDYNRNYSAFSSVTEVTTGMNNPPVISTSYDGDYKVKSHEVLKVTYAFSDPDNHSFTVDYNAGSKADVWQSNPDGTYTLIITGNADEPGRYESVITVTDAYGAQLVHKVNYEVLENHAPVIIKDIEDQLFTMAGQKLTLDMAEYLSDPDGEILKFDISITDKTVLHINPSDNMLYATTLGYGMTDVVIVASDSRGLTCTLPFKVLVKDPSTPMSLYPNPVVDYLNVSTMDEMPTHITIFSSTGKTVYDQTSDVSAFEPARIDMTACPPGQYKVTVEFGEYVFNRSIVKL